MRVSETQGIAQLPPLVSVFGAPVSVYFISNYMRIRVSALASGREGPKLAGCVDRVVFVVLAPSGLCSQPNYFVYV